MISPVRSRGLLMSVALEKRNKVGGVFPGAAHAPKGAVSREPAGQAAPRRPPPDVGATCRESNAGGRRRTTAPATDHETGTRRSPGETSGCIEPAGGCRGRVAFIREDARDETRVLGRRGFRGEAPPPGGPGGGTRRFTEHHPVLFKTLVLHNLWLVLLISLGPPRAPPGGRRLPFPPEAPRWPAQDSRSSPRTPPRAGFS